MKLTIINENGELHGFKKVPGKWRCLACTTVLDGEERPACECGGRVMAMSWAAWGNEAWNQAHINFGLSEDNYRRFQQEQVRAECWKTACIVAACLAVAEAVTLLCQLLLGR
jgi:hypothetical protein